MTKNEVVKTVIEKLKDILDIMDVDPIEINERTIPDGEIQKFDSLNGVELGMMLEGEFDIENLGNICASKDGRRSLSIGEMADRIIKLIQS